MTPLKSQILGLSLGLATASKSEYVNCHPFVLHLWRPIKEVIPIPNKLMV